MLHRELLPNGQTQLTFSLPAQDPPGEVSVVGDFNGWRAGMHRMLMSEDDIRQVSVTVEPGTHYFRYLATGGRWADEREADLITEHGSVVHCSEVEVVGIPEQATAERPRGDMMDARLDPPAGQQAEQTTQAEQTAQQQATQPQATQPQAAQPQATQPQAERPGEQPPGRPMPAGPSDQTDPQMDTDSDLTPRPMPR